jgi:hypothetical protein
MENLENLKDYQKESHSNFDFFINKLDEEKNKTYIEEILGMPKLPMIGHYNGNEYNFGNILSLICFQIDICQGKDSDEISSKYSDFKLPNNIKDYLNVYEEIEIENNTKNKKLNAIFYPKKKLNFYFIISTLPATPHSKKEENDNYNIYNIVPHLYYNKDSEIDFSQTKRIVFEKALSLFNIDENDKNDISYFKKDKNDISINDLRIEYSSLHLKKGSLAFSPNNLRFKLDISNPLSHFYLIMNIKENDYHSVFYYVVCNNEQSEIVMKNILKKSNNIKEIVDNIKVDFPISKNVYNNLIKLFSIEEK